MLARWRWAAALWMVGSTMSAAASIPAGVAAGLAQFAEARQDRVIVVDIARQQLTFYRAGFAARSWPVSTATKGAGNREGSEQTPLGWHVVASRIGAGAPLGAIFEGRRDTGRVAEIEPRPVRTGKDQVTTRILWLAGLEPGVNAGPGVDSRRRYIYIHGTHEEGLIGQPASHGCVRMRNADVIELFDEAEVGTAVLIGP